MAIPRTFRNATRAITAGTPGILNLLFDPPDAQRRRTVHGCHVAQCKAQPARPVAGTSGSHASSGIQFYASRSLPAATSACCFAIAESLHQFAVVDGVREGEAGGRCARFCAGRLPQLIARAFHDQLQRVPLWSYHDSEGVPLGNSDAAARVWAEALTVGFAQCDVIAMEELEGSCGALYCAVARSGVYIASVGLGRVVIGTEDAGSQTFWCDEASAPHCIENEAEAARLGQRPLLSQTPSRILGGAALKQVEPRLVGLPDVMRHRHADGQRFVILGSPGVWSHGARLPMQWVVEAYHAGRNPADAIVARSQGADVVALVLVLPPGLGDDGSPLPRHDQLASTGAD
mmetsp:Transcript_70095/g.193914  ORF Transcript_70095/g.193914 Transcript_70095/m.193914 type:complete len:346 (-) Transcript_70095:18-1055(-)